MLSAFILASCNKDQKLLNQVAGEWKIDKITFVRFSTGFADSVFTPRTGAFRFENCQQKEDPTKECDGFYELDAQARVTIAYHTNSELNQIFIKITQPDFPAFDLRGSYVIETLQENKLVIRNQGWQQPRIELSR